MGKKTSINSTCIIRCQVIAIRQSSAALSIMNSWKIWVWEVWEAEENVIFKFKMDWIPKWWWWVDWILPHHQSWTAEKLSIMNRWKVIKHERLKDYQSKTAEKLKCHIINPAQMNNFQSWSDEKLSSINDLKMINHEQLKNWNATSSIMNWWTIFNHEQLKNNEIRKAEENTLFIFKMDWVMPH